MMYCFLLCNHPPSKPCRTHYFQLAHFNTFLCLRNVSIPSRPILFSLQKLLLNQPIDILLDPTYFQCASTPRCLDRLRHKLCMTNSLPCLENAHNGCLRLVIAIRRNPFMGLLVLRRGLFELHCVDFNAVFGVCKGSVERKSVGGADFTRFGIFGEGTDFCAGKRLKGTI
jgi:hypothetical protein